MGLFMKTVFAHATFAGFDWLCFGWGVFGGDFLCLRLLQLQSDTILLGTSISFHLILCSVVRFAFLGVSFFGESEH
jgi:hypothetical protein